VRLPHQSAQADFAPLLSANLFAGPTHRATVLWTAKHRPRLPEVGFQAAASPTSKTWAPAPSPSSATPSPPSATSSGEQPRLPRQSAQPLPGI